MLFSQMRQQLEDEMLSCTTVQERKLRVHRVAKGKCSRLVESSVVMKPTVLTLLFSVNLSSTPQSALDSFQ